MIPADIGLPAKFTQFRKSQFEAACTIAAGGRRFSIDSAPTGSGKSIIYMAAARMLDARTLVLTANKALQKQLVDDFGAIGLVDIRGQANYSCRALEHRKGFHGCDKGPCHRGLECELHPRHRSYHMGCAFYDQVRAVRVSRLCVTNYDFWMSANRYMETELLGPFELLILDEAHTAPDKLAEFCTVNITAEDCENLLECGLPPVEDGAEAWVNWAIEKKKVVLHVLNCAKKFGSEDIDRIKLLIDLSSKLEFLSTAHVWQRGEPSEPTVTIPGQATDWVGERAIDCVTFSPVWAHRYAEPWLFAHVPRVALFSATILPQTARYLGIAPNDLDYHEHASTFPVSRRPIYLIPTARISSKSTESDYRAQAIKIDQIIEGRLDRKGVIQPHSYDRAYRIRMGSAHRERMLWHKRGQVQPAVERYKQANSGAILISPAIEHGFDFPYEECEYQIIVKVPFPDMRSAVMVARKRSDKQYQLYLTVLNLVQMCGRGMRAEDDACETFILDDHILWVNKAAKAMIPGWFRAAYRVVQTIPTPPAKLLRRC